MRSVFLFFILHCMSMTLLGQEVLFHEEYDAKSLTSKWGPNRQHFGHLELDGGMFYANNEVITKDLFSQTSFRWGLSFRYHMKVLNGIRCGITAGSQIPVEIMKGSNEERIQTSTYQFKSGGFIRLRLGQRGDYLGHYFDFGAFLSYGFHQRIVTSIKMDNSSGGYFKHTRVIQSGGEIQDPFNYGISLGLGIDRLRFVLEGILSSDPNSGSLLNLFKMIGVGVGYALVRY